MENSDFLQTYFTVGDRWRWGVSRMGLQTTSIDGVEDDEGYSGLFWSQNGMTVRANLPFVANHSRRVGFPTPDEVQL